MGVFISYSSKDRSFAEKLSERLIENRIGVWLDQWEMKPGDSLIEKIQGGMEDSSYLLVILSKHSIESEWCKKERNVGLVKEIDSKHIVVIPILIEDCDIPLFFKDKVYADFRNDFNDGFKALFRSLSVIANDHMGRYYNDSGLIIDHSVHWGLLDDKFNLFIDFINIVERQDKSFLLQINVEGDVNATKSYIEQHNMGLSRVMPEALILMLNESSDFKTLNIKIENDQPYYHRIAISDFKTERIFYVTIRAVLMGVDDGNDIMIHLCDYMTKLVAYRKEKFPH